MAHYLYVNVEILKSTIYGYHSAHLASEHEYYTESINKSVSNY